MPKLIDLTGQRFGRLVVVERAGSEGPARWRCRCDCGTEKTVPGVGLRSGSSKSCGCLQREKAKARWERDPMIGRRFGKLLVLKRAENNQHNNSRWKCRCDCGGCAIVSGTALRAGKTRSCGCLAKEAASKRTKAELEPDQRFGKLRVVGQAPGRDSKGYPLWRLICDCGGTAISSVGRLRSGGTRSCGCLRASRLPKNKAPDLVGKRFGRLSVVRRLPNNERRLSVWLCVCDCEESTAVTGTSLVRGRTKSCGCLVREAAIAKLGRVNAARKAAK